MRKLKLILSIVALLCSVGSWAQPKDGVVPEVGAEYYLYNIESGRYMSRGSSYTTHVTVDGCGEVITVGGTEGNYTLHMASVSDANAFVANDGWVDGADSRKGEFSFVTANKDGYSNVYKLQLKDATTGYYWNGGSGAWGNECLIGELSEHEAASLWLFIPKATRQTLSAEGDDATFAITNPDFERFTDFGGWTRTGSGQDAEGNWNQSNGTAGTLARFMERWTGTWNSTTGTGDGGTLYDASIKQTVTLPAGKYRLSANVWAVNQATSEEVTGVTLYAGTAQQNISKAASADVVNVDFTSTGSVEIGLTIASTNANWVGIDNIRLTYMGEDLSLYIEAYHNAQTAAAAVNQSAPMTGTVLAALQQAISDYATVDETSKEALQGATSALNTATTNATNSISAYANAKAYLDEAATILEGTNVYTAAAYTTYYSTPNSKYDARTLTTEEANALVKISTGWHSDKTIDEILLSSWTIGGNQAHKFDQSLYINTWSTEGATDGSDFLAPFFEYWTDDTKSLGATPIVATITGLKASTTYSFTIRARVRQANSLTKIANGITMKVGEGDAVDISAGAQFGTGQFYIGNFSAVGETDAEGKLTCTITVAENSNISWLSFYNAKYTEGEDLSAYIADYEFALSTATTSRDAAAYAAVTGKERADLVAAITDNSTVDQESKSALIAAKEALEAATNTFVTAAATYTAFAELNKNVATTLGVALPTITTETVAADLNVESYIVAEYTAAKAYAQDYTDKLGAWTNAPGTNKGESWDGTTGDEADTYYDEYNKADRAMTQTVTLPAGDYVLIAKGRGSVNGRLTLTDGTETITFAHKSSTGRGIATDGTATFDSEATYANSNNGRGWEYRVLTFTSDGETETTLTFNWKTSGSNWCGLDDIELLCNPAPLDYSVLQTAYDALVIPTLGFEEDEYAPYNNVDNLNNIAAAKNMLEVKDATSQDAIIAAKNAITGMTWNANTEELNAFYKGDFAEYTEDTATPLDYTPNGWTASNNFRLMLADTETYPGLSYASATRAVMSWSGGITYGETEGYTMPLKANTVYKLTFKAAGWNNESRSGITVSILNSEDGMAAYDLGTPDRDIKGNENNTAGMTSYETVFATGAAGNYVFHIQSGHNMVLTDFEIKKADSQDLTFDDNASMPKYAPGTYPSVKISRDLTAGKWATAVYPFAVSGVDNIAVLNSYNAETGALGFTTAAASTANQPFLMKSASNKSEISLNNVEVFAAEATQVKKDEAKLIGTYSQITVTNAEKNYVISDNKIRPAGSTGATINPYRAYIQVEQPGEEARALTFFVDGETTGISNLNPSTKSEDKVVYNLNGQRVQKAQKGIYIINGKKAIVK